MRTAIFWIAQAILIAASQYFYHPSLALAGIGSVLLFGLVLLGVWSAKRSASGVRGILIGLIVAGVSGFMFSQAMDVAYALLSAPEGLRFTVVFESLFAALWIGISSLVARAWLPRTQIKEESSGS